MALSVPKSKLKLTLLHTPPSLTISIASDLDSARANTMATSLSHVNQTSQIGHQGNPTTRRDEGSPGDSNRNDDNNHSDEDYDPEDFSPEDYEAEEDSNEEQDDEEHDEDKRPYKDPLDQVCDGTLNFSRMYGERLDGWITRFIRGNYLDPTQMSDEESEAEHILTDQEGGEYVEDDTHSYEMGNWRFRKGAA